MRNGILIYRDNSHLTATAAPDDAGTETEVPAKKAAAKKAAKKTAAQKTASRRSGA